MASAASSTTETDMDVPGPRSFEHPQNVVLKQILEANLDIVSSARAAADPAVTSRRAVLHAPLRLRRCREAPSSVICLTGSNSSEQSTPVPLHIINRSI